MEQVQALNIDVITGTINPIPKIADKGDDTLWVTFESASHFNDVKTRELQRPVFEMMEYVKIIVPGDTSSIVHRPVRPSDIERWPRQYAAFKVGREQQQGTPLSEWPYITRAQVDELAYFKIQTVEQLSTVSDIVAQKFQGINQLRDKAKVYLDQIKGESPSVKLQAEIQHRDEQIGALQNQLKMMQDAIDEMKKSREAEDA